MSPFEVKCGAEPPVRTVPARLTPVIKAFVTTV